MPQEEKKAAPGNQSGKLEMSPFFTLLLVISVACFVLSLAIYANHNFALTTKDNVANIAFDILGMLISVVSLAAVLRGKESFDETMNRFAFAMGLVSIGMFFDFFLDISEGNQLFKVLAVVGKFAYYALAYLMYEIFFDFLIIHLKIKETKFGPIYTKIVDSLWIAFTVILVFNYRMGFCFTVDPKLGLQKGSYYWIAYAYPVAICVFSIFVTLQSQAEKSAKIVFCISFVLNMLIMGIENFKPGLHLIYPSILVSLMVIYTNIFADRGKELAQKELELTNQRFAVMISQIQPHFLYNSLSTIRYLIRKDPVTAETAVIKFSDYLRTNLDSLKKSDMIPLQKELDHVDNYLFLEKLRFADRLDIEYELEADKFEVPAISIQPLVENAVKHGIQAKESGGVVVISTRETDKYYEIEVADNGVGFDMEAYKHDGKNHVGMENVRQRIKRICGGTLEVNSVVGKGTISTIHIPKH